MNLKVVSNLHKSVNGIPNIKHHCLLDSCPSCLSAKLRRISAGYGDLRRDSQVIGQGMSLDWAFLVHKSKDEGIVQRLTGLYGSHAYLLATDHKSGHL